MADDDGVDVWSMLFGEGDAVFGWGRLLHTPEGDWFDPPLPVALRGYPGARPVTQASRFSTPVEGADLDAVEGRYDQAGAVEGFAMIYGTWLGDRIRVARQTDERPERRDTSWTVPPCPPPAGGWPRGATHPGGANLTFDLGDLEDTGAAVTVVTFRPGPGQAVLVVAADDVAAVEAQLRPQLGDRLCVVPSRWSRTQLDQGRDHLTTMTDRWRIYMWGPRCDEQAQPTIAATLVRVTDEIADWATAQPDGLVTFEPCLKPAALSARP